MIIQGRRDFHLDEAGRAQAAAVGAWLASKKVGALIASPLARAAETGRILAAACGIAEPRFDPMLMEIDTGMFSGISLDEARLRFPEVYAAFERRSWDGVPDAEKSGPLYDRAMGAWGILRDMAAPGRAQHSLCDARRLHPVARALHLRRQELDAAAPHRQLRNIELRVKPTGGTRTCSGSSSISSRRPAFRTCRRSFSRVAANSPSPLSPPCRKGASPRAGGARFQGQPERLGIGEGRQNFDSLPGSRLGEGQTPGVEHDETIRRAASRAVLEVAAYGESGGRELCANLVVPPGDERDFHEKIALRSAQETIVQPRAFSPAPCLRVFARDSLRNRERPHDIAALVPYQAV